MKHGRMIISAVLLLLIGLSGCSVRTYEIEKARTDLEITGNRGYLVGEVPPAESTDLQKTRKISVTEIELGFPFSGRKKKAQPDSSNMQSQKEDPACQELTESDSISAEESASVQFYTVEKNDTLQKISQKFYKTTRKWQKIFEANRDILKNPNSIRPGQVIKIP